MKYCKKNPHQNQSNYCDLNDSFCFLLYRRLHIIQYTAHIVHSFRNRFAQSKKCQTVTSFPLFCPSCWCLWMSVKIYFIFFMFFLFLFVYRKIKLICHGCRTSHSKEKSRNIDPSANTGLRYNEPAERQAQKKRCYKWQPKLRKHCDISQDLWPLFQYLSPFSLIFIYYFHCA